MVRYEVLNHPPVYIDAFEITDLGEHEIIFGVDFRKVMIEGGDEVSVYESPLRHLKIGDLIRYDITNDHWAFFDTDKLTPNLRLVS